MKTHINIPLTILIYFSLFTVERSDGNERKRQTNVFLFFQNAKLSRDLLLGSNFAGDKPFNLSIQGLFNEKSKTNLFQVCHMLFSLES